MATETTLTHKIGQAVYHFSSACEEALTTTREMSCGALLVSSYFWLNGKISGNCFFGTSQNQWNYSTHCIQDEEAFQIAITTNIACLALLAGAMVTKCVSRGVMRQNVSHR